MIIMNICKESSGELSAFRLRSDGIEANGNNHDTNTMMCVASEIPCGHELHLKVNSTGAASERFVFFRNSSCKVGDLYARAHNNEKETLWHTARGHTENDTAKLLVIDEDVIGVWPGEALETRNECFEFGMKALFYNCGKADMPKASLYLTAAYVLGDATAATILILYRSLFKSEDQRDLFLTEELKPYSMSSWLARLVMARLLGKDKCNQAARHYIEVLRIVSPAQARIQSRYFFAAPNELLAAHWNRADGYDKLLEEQSEDEDIYETLSRSTASNERSAVTAIDSFRIGNYLQHNRGDAFGAVSYYEQASSEILEAREALAELYLSGEEGVDYNLSRAMDLLYFDLNQEDYDYDTAHSIHLKAHILATIYKEYDRAIQCWRIAIDRGYIHSKLSLALFLLRADDKNETTQREALSHLQSAFEHDASLTAGLALGQYFLNRNMCDKAVSILSAAIQHSWDLEIGNFGMKHATRLATALWSEKHYNFFSVWPKDKCKPEEAATDSYYMFAVLAEAGIKAADVNAGFIAEKKDWPQRSIFHYRRATQDLRRQMNTKKKSETPFFLKARALETAEALRALADLTKDNSSAQNYSRLASSLGSGWAMFDTAINEPYPKKGIRLARRCSHFVEFPNNIPCTLLLCWLRIKLFFRAPSFHLGASRKKTPPPLLFESDPPRRHDDNTFLPLRPEHSEHHDDQQNEKDQEQNDATTFFENKQDEL